MKSDNILVVYHFTKFDKISSLINFLKKYKRNTPGTKHTLLICLKLIHKNELKKIIKIINDYIKSTKKIFIDPSKFNDFDLGSYYRVAKKFKNHKIIFLNSHSQPEKKNWLKKINYFANKKTIVGFTASFSSRATNSFKRNQNDNYFTFLKNIIFSYIYFPRFPNPHIRTTGFGIYGSDFIEFINKSRKIKSKFDAHVLESGKNGLSNFFIKKGYKIHVVNSTPQKFSLNSAQKSDTYFMNNQKKLLMSDNHTRLFLSYNSIKKKNAIKRVWGR